MQSMLYDSGKVAHSSHLSCVPHTYQLSVQPADHTAPSYDISLYNNPHKSDPWYTMWISTLLQCLCIMCSWSRDPVRVPTWKCHNCMGDQPVRSYENTTLVRVLHSCSLYLNERVRLWEFPIFSPLSIALHSFPALIHLYSTRAGFLHRGRCMRLLPLPFRIVQELCSIVIIML